MEEVFQVDFSELPKLIEKQVPRFSCSDIAGITGYNPWQDILYLFDKYMYQDLNLLMQLDAMQLDVDIVTGEEDVQLIINRLSPDVKEKVRSTEMKIALAKLDSHTEAQILLASVDSLLEEVKKVPTTLSEEDLSVLAEDLKGRVRTGYGITCENWSLDKYEDVTGFKVTERNAEYLKMKIMPLETDIIYTSNSSNSNSTGATSTHGQLKIDNFFTGSSANGTKTGRSPQNSRTSNTNTVNELLERSPKEDSDKIAKKKQQQRFYRPNYSRPTKQEPQCTGSDARFAKGEEDEVVVATAAPAAAPADSNTALDIDCAIAGTQCQSDVICIDLLDSDLDSDDDAAGNTNRAEKDKSKSPRTTNEFNKSADESVTLISSPVTSPPAVFAAAPAPAPAIVTGVGDDTIYSDTRAIATAASEFRITFNDALLLHSNSSTLSIEQASTSVVINTSGAVESDTQHVLLTNAANRLFVEDDVKQASKRARVLPVPKINRFTAPAFMLIGKVDGVSYQLDMTSDDPSQWKETKVVVEMKSRIQSIKNPPPLYEQIQLMAYMIMMGSAYGDLVQSIASSTATARDTKSVTPAADGFSIYRVELYDPLMRHKEHWDSTIIPRLRVFRNAILLFRTNDSLRYKYLLAEAEERLELLKQHCPYVAMI